MSQRRLFSSLLGIVLLLASQFSVAETQNTRQIIDAYMQSWNDHKPEKAATFLAENALFVDASVGTPQVGRQAARDNVISVFIKAVPDLKWEMIGEPIINGENIAFEWKFSGINSGSWGIDTPATNRPLTFKGVSFIRLKDNKILTQNDYYDALGFNKQLGW